MEQPRFVETGQGSFYGEYLYEQIVPANHFLRKLNEVIDWRWFTRKLIKLYKGESVVGRPLFDPAGLAVLPGQRLPHLLPCAGRNVGGAK